jgi:tripartite-type tricarboxylate transporter receptor subunit TctC
MKKLLFAVLLVALALPVFAAGQAETATVQYPKEPVQVIIPYAPGGGSDILTRAIMKYIEMPQPLVAINIDGAAGMIGAMQAYHAPNKGYNILAHNPMDVVSYSMSGQTEIELWDELERAVGKAWKRLSPMRKPILARSSGACQVPRLSMPPTPSALLRLSV